MSEKSAPERPRQVTLAASFIMGGSVLVVLLVMDMIGGLHSLDTRESVERFLSQPPGDGTGLSVDGALGVMRALGMVAAGCATAAAILGYSVLRRDRRVRLALTVLAVPLLVTGLVTGGFVSSMVAAAAFMLWMQPARDWFNGIKPTPRPTPAPAENSTVEAMAGRLNRLAGSAPPPAEAAPSQPRPMTAYGDTPAHPVTADPARPEPAPAARPSTVVWSCLLTWFFSALAVVVMTIGLAYLAASPDGILTDLREQNPELEKAGLTDTMVLTVTYVTGAAMIVWAISAMVLAWLVWRGVYWARIVAMVSVGGAIVILGIGVVTQIVMLVPFLAAGFTLTMLARPETSRWVQHRRSAPHR